VDEGWHIRGQKRAYSYASSGLATCPGDWFRWTSLFLGKRQGRKASKTGLKPGKGRRKRPKKAEGKEIKPNAAWAATYENESRHCA